MSSENSPIPRRSYPDIRAALLARRELALLDVREEDQHAQGHPLFAANLPLSRIESDSYARLPRREVAIVTLDQAGEDGGEAVIAARRLLALGYRDVAILRGGVEGWRSAGGELFRDVNVPSKAFGELVDAQRHTPSLSAGELKALIDARADLVVMDARRFDEYQTMSIPTAISVPGAELLLRVAQLAPRPETRVIVNCAGRTRSILGAQSLINAGLPNPVTALRNGTIGWTLAGLTLDHGQSRQADADTGESIRRQAAVAARAVADLAGVKRASLTQLGPWRDQVLRTTYFFDVRPAVDYAAGHLPGFCCAPGGQLVQETEMLAPVRGARLVLADRDGVAANISASWLAQMGWEVQVVEDAQPEDFRDQGDWRAPLPPLPDVRLVSGRTLADWLDIPGEAVVLDVSSSPRYRDQHLPGAWFILRSRLKNDLPLIPRARRYVLTSRHGRLAAFVVQELQALVGPGCGVTVLDGGTEAWIAAGYPCASGLTHFASDPVDRYRRPYEGTDNPKDAMQAYLDWEYGLVAQLARDGTHHFTVI